MINILLAPNSMKGSLSALKFADIMEKAFLDYNPDFFNLLKLPIADGGDETTQVLKSALNLEISDAVVSDPLMRPVKAFFGNNNDIAFIEMANASGMKLLSDSELNPLITSSYGTGQLIMEATKRGAKKIYLAIGGSATVDGGMGMLEALGVKFYDRDGQLMTGNGGNLNKISEIDINELDKYHDTEITIICDVVNPLLGANGAAQVFGPQKGATVEMIELLEMGLANFEKIIYHKTNIKTSTMKGSGAAGGISIGLVAFLNAMMVKGSEFIMDILNFKHHLQWADIVVTGEGKHDDQSFFNKAPYALAILSKKYGKPVYAIVGINESIEQDCFNGVYSLINNNVSISYAINHASDLVYERAKDLAEEIYCKLNK